MATSKTSEGPDCEVVAVVRDGESLDFLQTYLSDAVAGEVHLQKGRIADAVAYLERAAAPPRLLIVDLSGLETPLSEVDRLADVCEPNVVVVAIGETNNTMLFRELMRAGVADYITKPLMPDFLEPYVRERRTTVVETAQQARRGRIVAFAGARGGVGATTLAVACAWRMSEVQKRRVAFVDLDLHGGAASVQLGLQSGGLMDALQNHARLDALYLERTLVKANPRLSVMADEAPLRADAPLAAEAVDALLAVLAEDFHYVFVDLPRRFGEAHAHVFGRARTRVVVVDRTLPALRDGARMMELARDATGATIVAVNDHHPGLKGLVNAETLARAIGRAPDLEIDYDRAAAQRGDNLGAPLGAGATPIGHAAEKLNMALAGRTAKKVSRMKRALKMLGAA